MFESGLPPEAQPISFVHKRILGGVVGFITGGPTAGIAGFVGGGGGGGAPGLGGDRGLGFAPSQPATCTWPMKRDPNTGLCKTFIGTQPGPDQGREAAGVAVEGGFNMPAFVPSVVGNITRMDGSTGPILRCPRGTVLATDNLCYPKGVKGLAAFRKWKPARAPFLPRRDLAALDRVASLRKNKTLKGRFKALGLC